MQERKPGCICELDPITGNPTFNNYAECPVHKLDAPDPKLTAKGLIDEFKPLVTTWDCYHDCPRDEGDVTKDAAKCADIVVDKILDVLDTFQRYEYAKILIPFYKEVRDEITKMYNTMGSME